ncbi:MAG: polysaccharide deacetylase family protein, partial [Acidobacteria bacterium]|nr:polysaccharide deacetylase family protein [Acidobacteriota bacterium]
MHLAPYELEAILRHELAHVRRHDYLVNLLQSLIETVFFYHPAAWWISVVIRREREFACDDFVIQSGKDKFIYARALTNLEQIRLASANETNRLALAAGSVGLRGRVERIIKSENKTRRSRFPALISGLSLLAVAAILINAPTSFFQTARLADEKIRAKKIAVGFVAIPPVIRPGNPLDESALTGRILIENLKAHHVPAIGFVLGSAISDGEKFYPARADIVRLWRDAGLEIGIGNFNHVWFYHTPYEEYVAGVEKNERIVKQILAEKNLPLRYFSYPFLNTGKTAEDKAKFENWLTDRNLKSVSYTVDNEEWMYSYAYDAAHKSGDVERVKEIRAEFLDYMAKTLDHYEAYSQEMFGRDINQTMVLTTSRLVADSSNELFGMIEKRGYQFVSIDEAQADEAYQTPDTFADKSGVSWFSRWTITRDGKLRDQPQVG